MVYSIHPANINNGKLKILIKLVYAWVQNVILYLMLQNLSLKPFGKFRIKGKNFWKLEYDIMHVWMRRENSEKILMLSLKHLPTWLNIFQ